MLILCLSGRVVNRTGPLDRTRGVPWGRREKNALMSKNGRFGLLASKGRRAMEAAGDKLHAAAGCGVVWGSMHDTCGRGFSAVATAFVVWGENVRRKPTFWSIWAVGTAGARGNWRRYTAVELGAGRFCVLQTPQALGNAPGGERGRQIGYGGEGGRAMTRGPLSTRWVCGRLLYGSVRWEASCYRRGKMQGACGVCFVRVGRAERRGASSK